MVKSHHVVSIKLKMREYCSVQTNLFLPRFYAKLAEMSLEAAERANGPLRHGRCERVGKYEMALRNAEVFKLDRWLIIRTTLVKIMRWRVKRPRD
ncbi:MAG: hypothetical protein QXR18_09460, partial [Pyrobaculum sp.]